MKLLDDYIFDDRLRYEGHKMVYTPEGNEDIVIQGILGAALLSSKTGLYQFRRAWNELSRYNPAVHDELEHLAELGVKAVK